MKNSTIQIILKVMALLLIVMTIASFSTIANAANGTPISPADLENNVDYGNDDGGLTAKVGKVMGTIRNIAIVASVIVLMVLGVKYILASVEEKADMKKTFLILIIGMVLVVSATSLVSFIFNTVL